MSWYSFWSGAVEDLSIVVFCSTNLTSEASCYGGNLGCGMLFCGVEAKWSDLNGESKGRLSGLIFSRAFKSSRVLVRIVKGETNSKHMAECLCLKRIKHCDTSSLCSTGWRMRPTQRGSWPLFNGRHSEPIFERTSDICITIFFANILAACSDPL